MKIKSILPIALITVMAGLFTSCTINKTEKEVRVMPIHFQQLDRADYTMVGNLKAEATVVKDKKGNLKGDAAKNYKMSDYNDLISREIFVPVTQEKKSALSQVFEMIQLILKPMAGIKRDAGADFALYALFEKYPDIDYFTNVRLERRKVIAGATITETVIITATGIELRTDKK
mgnify:CR=1 FL=1